ncbi:glycoside hydrolase family 32 protein [Sinomonas sp. P47F7]|uniref:glycoside hydrolase family 32 protein n=1 Tax=Sinomonas sp. P47F7 TaxID=3410987 RepID=UPI003BF558B7
MTTAPTRDLYRPRAHYTPAEGWINDPNGLVFHDGTYHLFYQHNPFGPDWGNMSWGHATSPDLVTWTEQPVAIPCSDTEAIFSGSAVVDAENTSGFGDGATAPLVAVYTSAYGPGSGRDGIQAQSLAYSFDGGATWTKYGANPVLDRGSAEFRDPKVFRYSGPAGTYWVMVAVEAKEQRVLLYRSADLRDWEYLSEVTLEEPGDGVWECPDLFELPIDGDPARTAWVLVISTNPGGVAGGSGTRYFIGEFDGAAFQAAPVSGSWLDWGRDYYAAVSFNGLDAAGEPGRRVTVGWMNNWDYAHATPTGTWRSAMSLPREVSLRTVGGRVRLVQVPAAAQFAALRVGDPREGGRAVVRRGEPTHVSVERRADDGAFGLRLSAGGGEVVLTADPAAGQVTLDRTGVPAEFHALFPSVETAPLDSVDGTVRLDVYVDACSLEVFIQGGLATITDLVFGEAEEAEIEFFAAQELTEIP